MKTKELRALDAKSLDEKLAEQHRSLFTVRFQHATAQLENTQQIPLLKKDIAKILTIKREREMGA